MNRWIIRLPNGATVEFDDTGALGDDPLADVINRELDLFANRLHVSMGNPVDRFIDDAVRRYGWEIVEHEYTEPTGADRVVY